MFGRVYRDVQCTYSMYPEFVNLSFGKDRRYIFVRIGIRRPEVSGDVGPRLGPLLLVTVVYWTSVTVLETVVPE